MSIKARLAKLEQAKPPAAWPASITVDYVAPTGAVVRTEAIPLWTKPTPAHGERLTAAG